ncbi:CBS domain-containing protein [Paraburkholderia sp. 35.1]|uniref:CBS domain-containing protein n=1 Tax=Paraburkholderia sp. 35.1 TaxID=2991058 RepID=UPI003D1EFD66
MRASDIMTNPVVSIAPDNSVYDAAKPLIDHRISGMPVVDDNGDVIGVVSEGDLLRRVETGTEKPRRSWLAEFMAPTRELAAEYLKEHSAGAARWHAKELDGHRWAMAADRLIVTEGIVHCWGVVRSEEERQAILAAAARVPGVKTVKDRPCSRRPARSSGWIASTALRVRDSNCVTSGRILRARVILRATRTARIRPLERWGATMTTSRKPHAPDSL